MADKQAHAVAFVVALLAALAGCGSESPPQCLAPSALPPSLELGSGATTFEPLVEGGTIRAYQGPQGGFHVLLWVRATGIDPGAPGESPSGCDQAGNDAQAPCVDFTVTDLTVGTTFSVFAPLHLPLSCTPDET